MRVSATLLIASLAALGFHHAASAQSLDASKGEYIASCATCHGEDGKGNGPLGAALKTRPADLTVLAKKNNGVFPISAIYDAIDGRQVVTAHGTREMPIWGNRFRPDLNMAASPNAPDMFVNPVRSRTHRSAPHPCGDRLPTTNSGEINRFELVLEILR
jgi:mono/diheme cytochrome c family protein